jgi:sugar phosphate permease
VQQHLTRVQMLIGLCGAELISPKSVGASQGILGLISYMGAAAAGIPLSFMQVSIASSQLQQFVVASRLWIMQHSLGMQQRQASRCHSCRCEVVSYFRPLLIVVFCQC